MAPEITRTADGKIRRHWTTESAEAAIRERRKQSDEIIQGRRQPRRSLARRLVDRVLKVLSGLRRLMVQRI
jgi:hypothetical protein